MSYTLTELCDKWNEATCPYKLRTDHEHNRNRQLARAIDNRMTRECIFRGAHWRELSNGMRIPVKTVP